MLDDINSSEVLDVLKNARLIKVYDGRLRASERFVYYFFVAKYFYQKMHSDKIIREDISLMCKRLDIEEYAGIIMFLTHLSKDNTILDLIVENAQSQFFNVEPLNLQNDIGIINGFIDSVPQLVIDNVQSYQKNRNEVLKKETEIERLYQDSISDKDIFEEEDYDDTNDSAEDISSFVPRVTRAFKTIEILGQIVKKYWAQLDGEQKIRLTTATYLLGLRVLAYWANLVQDNQNTLTSIISSVILKKSNERNTLLRSEVEAIAKRILFQISEASVYNVIKHISKSIGYDELFKVFESVNKKHDTFSTKLIDISIKLDYGKKLPYDDIEKYKEEFRKNYLCSIVLRDLAVNYAFMFKMSRIERERMSALYDIPIKTLLLISGESQIKQE
ncbi:MAG: hypothetical protein ACKVTZ_03115 [Bacteroidia bacterium]